LIPKDLIYFDGHFEKTPVLPGVVQVHWARKFALEYFEISARFSHLEVIKFSHIIQPNEIVDISLSYNEEKRKVVFSYSSEKGKHASGRICFAPD
jgi:3-hydroxymyristoyl/3-hydroxydecanoyl-(acyl carrier protein) dehydratase